MIASKMLVHSHVEKGVIQLFYLYASIFLLYCEKMFGPAWQGWPIK